MIRYADIAEDRYVRKHNGLLRIPPHPLILGGILPKRDDSCATDHFTPMGKNQK